MLSVDFRLDDVGRRGCKRRRNIYFDCCPAPLGPDLVYLIDGDAIVLQDDVSRSVAFIRFDTAHRAVIIFFPYVFGVFASLAHSRLRLLAIISLSSRLVWRSCGSSDGCCLLLLFLPLSSKPKSCCRHSFQLKIY